MSATQVRVHPSDWINVCSMIRRVWPGIFGPAGTLYEQKEKEGHGGSTLVLPDDPTRVQDGS